MTETPFLTLDEAAALLRWQPETLRKKVERGTFTLGKHYFRIPGAIGIRFDRQALIDWLKDPNAQRKGNGIPMARGYTLGEKD